MEKSSLTIEDMIKLVAQGEGEQIEFKVKPTGIAETIGAMANASGGHIVVGVDNKGELVGITEKGQERIASHIQGLIPTPSVSISTIKINDKNVLVIEVHKSRRFVTLGNTAYIRIGRSNKALDIEELAILSVEELKVTFDALSSAVPKEALNPSLVQEYLELRKKTRDIPIRGNLKENIKRMKIIKGECLTISGLLFFTDRPQEHLPWTGMRVIELYPDGETKGILEFDGPVWKMIDHVYETLLGKLPRREIRTGAKRESFLIFPEEAIREGIINAVAHRNYRTRADIRIFLRPEGLGIKNPGSFPPGVDLEDPEHIPRNPLICQYLYDMGYIERYGFGIIRMRKAVEDHPTASMDFKIGPMKTEVVFESKQQTILGEDERIILTLLKRASLPSSQIAAHLKMSKVTALKKLDKLQSMNLIKRIGKGKKTRYTVS